ncbi:hypothetical protein [Salinimonas iocasae]|uniref:Uncharacterized protein n=1 Tax=Salinimonas iocasae TaxID=2572577 RepID=A0A5B7YGC7_9ALTE|nr:hypothetical protein [Salinimonas iocasae]QCZ94677.1 hypothetical protein FBQ74_14910 [Salinimonas iocasae]
MRFLIILVALLVTTSIQAEDGLFTRLFFEKLKTDSNVAQSYNTGFLAEFNSNNTVDIAELYNLHIINRKLEDGTVNIFISLKDISTGKPYNIGANAEDFVIGEQKSFSFENNGYHYSISIDTSLNALPGS